ncbi:MAG: FAD-dependent oxidoreductase [Halofilum sp. (in: g-proteobacteria)]|nr:FAD-dependent oxidoreductase [Halofilum sp. (in: g-proteobacteria)]
MSAAAPQAVDVAIAGAGFAGLSAAAALRRAGRSVAVLEARDRVGGRAEGTRDRFGGRADLGAQFLCDDMVELLALLRDCGLGPRPTPAAGRPRAQPSPLAAGAGADDPAATAFARAWDCYQALPGPTAAGADRSVAAWVAALDAPPAVRAALASTLECIWCTDLRQLPLAFIATQRGRLGREADEMQYFVDETLHAVAERLAQELGQAIVCDTPVTRVRHGDTGVELDSPRRRVRARAAILALPPVVVPRIAFEPALPAGLARALAAWRGGDVIKFVLRYASPFWRCGGWNGTVTWSEPSGLHVSDASATDGPATLVGFAGGPLARAWHGLGAPERRRRLLALLTDALGPPAAAPLDLRERSWVDDPWSGGGYNAVITDADRLDAEDRLRAGAPPLHFAGAELAERFPGYVEGALRSGRAVARRVLGSLPA